MTKFHDFDSVLTEESRVALDGSSYLHRWDQRRHVPGQRQHVTAPLDESHIGAAAQRVTDGVDLLQKDEIADPFLPHSQILEEIDRLRFSVRHVRETFARAAGAIGKCYDAIVVGGGQVRRQAVTRIGSGASVVSSPSCVNDGGLAAAHRRAERDHHSDGAFALAGFWVEQVIGCSAHAYGDYLQVR